MTTELQASYGQVLPSTAHPGMWFVRLYTEGGTVIGALAHNGAKFFESDAEARRIAKDRGINITN